MFSPGFTDNPLNMSQDKNDAAINNRCLDFVQTRGLILLVNDNYVDNYLKEMLAIVYHGLY